MHIAVCMDVAADRKQLERLLGRSADRRLAACPDVPYYVQSYGNKDALLARPFMYDLFFIDIHHAGITSVELFRELRAMGVIATIVLCPVQDDAVNELTPDDDALILRQPVQVDELEHILDAALEVSKDTAPKLDIRGIRETVIIDEDEFMYAVKNGDMIDAHLKDGRVISCSELMGHFSLRCEKFANLHYVSPELLLHSQAVMSTGFGSIVLQDGAKFRVSHRWIRKLEGLIR